MDDFEQELEVIEHTHGTNEEGFGEEEEEDEDDDEEEYE